jgi:penicillin-binding protein 1A
VYDAPSHLVIPLTGQKWDVHNFEDEGGGRMNLVDATVHSINTVYAQLVLEVGPALAVQTAAKIGIMSPLDPYPSAVLGTNDVSPLDMASAYGTFATRGLHVDPVLVTKVVGGDGTPIYEAPHVQKRVLKEETVDAEVGVLQQVVTRGTGVNARIGRPVAGKTGTGEDYRDAWFVGFTPELSTAVWVGFPSKGVSMVPPTTRIRVQGGTWPAQIWQLYMSAALANTPVTPFPPAPPLVFGADAPPQQVAPVVGMPVDRAEAALSADGFRAVRHMVTSDEYPPGYVVAQSPAGGSSAPGGSTVTLDVSSGPATATVPDLLDQTRDAATRAVTGAGLKPVVIVQQEPKSPGSGSRKGKVWKQSPSGGTRTDRGATVTFWVNPP